MKATLVEYTEIHAVVRLDPGWIGRLFGARPTTVELGRSRQPGSKPNTITYTEWCAPGSGRALDGYFPHFDLIRDALDFHEVADVPRAVAKERIP